jgi:hypothetical protein
LAVVDGWLISYKLQATSYKLQVFQRLTYGITGEWANKGIDKDKLNVYIKKLMPLYKAGARPILAACSLKLTK